MSCSCWRRMGASYQATTYQTSLGSKLSSTTTSKLTWSPGRTTAHGGPSAPSRTTHPWPSTTRWCASPSPATPMAQMNERGAFTGATPGRVQITDCGRSRQRRYSWIKPSATAPAANTAPAIVHQSVTCSAPTSIGQTLVALSPEETKK